MKLSILLAFLSATLCAQQADVTIKKNITQIAFGSCSEQELTNRQLWDEVNFMEPDLWIWLGDNIYGDTEDMQVMRQKYDLQKRHPGYQKLIANTEIIGTWDDHDYGVNDGGKEYPKKKESKEELLRFLETDEDHPVRKRSGVYQSYSYQSNSGTVKVILLDTRTFRDSLIWKRPTPGNKEAQINATGDILGESQWKWLKDQLTEDVDLVILASSIQVIPTEHVFEKWSNFPVARKRLLDLVSTTQKPILILSGDRHLSEVSRLEVASSPYPIYEFTSSSLSSPSASFDFEPNQFREKNIVFPANFAHLDIVWKENYISCEVNYFGEDNKVLQTHMISYKR
ncbi:alkaline phosphatase D family protein [Ekhidna sp.]|uniref:alkaline phosphatase D family protein n=1 Tax=Ekhidna sp. TaxID=2608089 RepID=UPI003B5A062C